MSSIASAAARASAAHPRIVARLAIEFLIDQLQIARGDGRPVDAMLMLAITQTNIAHLLRDESQFTFDTPVADEHRRPVSVNALAASLRLPFETARRRINHLIAIGVCCATPAGVYVPQAALEAPRDVLSARAVYERLRRFYFDLRALGALPDLPDASRRIEGQASVRAAVRTFGGYMLRVLDALNRREGDVVEALTLMALICINTEGVTGAELYAYPTGVMPDEKRKPARIAEIAARIGMPPETVRRRISGLVARGSCVRTRRGLIAPATSLMSPEMGAIVLEHASELQRLFARLAQLGVLELWNRAAPASEP